MILHDSIIYVTTHIDHAAEPGRQYLYTAEKDLLLGRLKKIQGQARGIEKMIADGRYCLEIVQQLTALSAAAEELSLKLLESHIEGCVAGAIRAGDGSGQAHIKELMKAIRKSVKR